MWVYIVESVWTVLLMVPEEVAEIWFWFSGVATGMEETCWTVVRGDVGCGWMLKHGVVVYGAAVETAGETGEGG
jgi:hypothetical protein